jgi:hypothetical protein
MKFNQKCMLVAVVWMILSSMPLTRAQAGIRNWGLLIVTIPITITASGVVIASFFQKPDEKKEAEINAALKNVQPFQPRATSQHPSPLDIPLQKP